MKKEKPLGHRAYGSIGHLIGSRLGPSDRTLHEGQCRILTEKPRDKHDKIIVTEKLDGSNCSVAKINGEIIALGRAGYTAKSSPFEMHHIFAEWVEKNRIRFDCILNEGQRICGEWLVVAHGTKYNLKHEPYVVFDIMTKHDRIVYSEFNNIVKNYFMPANCIHIGEPLSIENAMNRLSVSHHGADKVEGAVWRVERKDKVDFLGKYVQPDKIDGYYFPGQPGNTTDKDIYNVDISKLI